MVPDNDSLDRLVCRLNTYFLMLSVSLNLTCSAIIHLKVVHRMTLCIEYSYKVIVVATGLFSRKLSVLNLSDGTVRVGQSFFDTQIRS